MNEVKLYINNQEIEFSSTPDILFTYQEDDLTNPTVVKNSYTKSITVPGTKQNNIIFNGIWNVERIQSEENFNVTKRVPFSLYINGDIYQTGYAKLDKISRSQNKIVYSITLYGGLGQFLYNLSIDWNTGDKKTLADMDYYGSSSEPFDLGFTINKDTVESAWTEVTSNNKWGTVNFAPTYIGHPDKISCDKVLINFKDAPITSAVTSGDTAYTPSGSYALGTLPQALSSEEVRDYRSYIQTPVIRVKSVFDAICRKENNAGRYDEGYDIELDNEFFTPSNPYYWDAWVTLPTITNLEFTSEGEDTGGTTTAYTKNYSSAYLDYQGNCIYTFDLDEPITGGNISVKATIDLGVTGNSSSDNLYFYYTRLKGRSQRVYYRNAYGIQLYASNSNALNENVLAGSNIKWLSGEQRYTYGDAVATGQFTPKWSTNVVENHTGYFTKVSGSTYHYTGATGNLLELICDLPIGSTCFKLFIKRCNSSYSAERNMLFTSTSPNSGEKIEVRPLPFNDRTIELSAIDSGESISNRYISKEMLLSTSYSPADWLLSYCKKFGLYIKKDRVEDRIYIMTRNTYYKRDEVVDIDSDIDYSKSFDINPVYCQNGYLSLSDEGVESKSFNDYTQKTGKIYGQKIVNTGYEFNADTKELNNGIFKGSIQAKDVSQYYNKRSDLGLLPYAYNGLKYTLYANGDFSASTYEFTYPQDEIANVCSPFDDNYPNYDLISKPMFTDEDGSTLETEGVLLFFNGYENVSTFKWYLTDDLAYMYKLNNNPTWIMTFSENDMAGNKIANQITNFPKFSRWLEGNRWMRYSFDYGSSRYLYVPDMINNDEANVYYNYYKKYYEDLYDVDTKVVDCYALGKFDEESLRKFYWFSNSIWRLNKVTDYNPTNHDTTKVQYIKVQDLNNMTNEVPSSELTLDVVLDKYILPYSGGTIIGTVTTSDNLGWVIESVTYTSTDSAYTITIEPESWGSSGNFYITADTNNTYDDIIVTIVVSSGDISKSVSFTQLGMDASNAYFTFQCVSGNNIPIVVARQDYSAYLPTNTGSIMIKKNNGNWQRLFTYDPSYGNDGYNATAEFTMSAGDVVMVKATYDRTGGTPFIGYVWGRFYHEFHIAPSSVYNNIDIRVYGNALSLLYADSFRNYTEFPNASGGYVFANLISTGVGVEKGGLTSAKKLVLPSENLTPYCYLQLLSENWGLKETPRLPSTHLAEGCYQQMFYGCTSLTKLPELPATTLANSCYNNMFEECQSLATIPSDYLPATTLADNCYAGMFECCIKVRTTPNLPADVLAPNCYQRMFAGCASLTTVRDLPATHLAPYCYAGMFSSAFIGSASMSCTALTNVPNVLPATELEEGCYNKMFQGCTSLRKAPELPAITLVSTSSYSYPEGACYGRMFDGCTSLNYIKCLAVERRPEDNTYATINWVSGVSQNGVFVANPAATTTGSNATWRITPAYSNIPYGWVYQNSNANRIEIKNLVWVNNIPASGGTADSGNCTFNVIAYFDNGSTGDITTVCTISGSKQVEPSYIEEEHAAGSLMISASYMGLAVNSSIEIIQDAYEPLVLTGISIFYGEDAYVPASGGTVTSADCSFIVYGYYTGGFYGHLTKDVTSESIITGSLEVPSSFIETMHYVDTLTLTASYCGFTDSQGFEVYQEAFVPSITGITIYVVQDDYVPASGGTVNYDSDIFRCAVYANYDNGATSDVTSSSILSSESVVIPPSYIEVEHTAGTMTLTATHLNFTTATTVSIWQDRFIVNITGLTIDNLSYEGFVPASGGTVYSGNCSYDVTAYLNNETTRDVTSLARVYGELIVPPTEITTSYTVGSLVLQASYSGLTATASTAIQQEGNHLSAVSFDSLSWVNDLPWSGGTATKDNCTYSLIGHYTNGTTKNRTQESTVSGSKSITVKNYLHERSSADTLTLTANLSGVTGSAEVAIYEQPVDISQIPLTFVFTSNGTITWTHNRTLTGDVGDKTINYRINNGSWTSLTSSTAGVSFNVNAGDRVEIKGDNTRYGSLPLSYNTFSGTTGQFSAEGNIMSMIYNDNYETATTLSEQYVFNRLLAGCTGMTTAEYLYMPSISIPLHGYTSLFEGSGLVKSPELPAIGLSNSCYDEMFKNCSNLNHIRCYATDISAANCTYNWVNGVSSTGTFVKEASMTGWGTGNSGIPTNWTTENVTRITAITLTNLTWVTDVPASGGTADSGNCTFNVIGTDVNGYTVDLTDESNVFGNSYVPSSYDTYRHSAGTLTLTAVFGNFTSSAITVVYQEAFIIAMTGLTIENLTWVTDVPARGGTADSGNCTFSVIAYFNDSSIQYVKNISTISGSLIVPATTATTREPVGTLELTAEYSGFTATGSTTAYQMAFVGYLSFDIISDGRIYWRYTSGNYPKYTRNGGEWYNLSNYITVSSGDTISFKADDAVGTFSGSTAGFIVHGNIMSLVSESGFDEITSITATTRFKSMFANCKGLVDASDLQLPAITLAEGCYQNMFDGCTGLTSAPELPATTLAQHCYQQMFYNCKSLTSVPSNYLHVTTLADYCYSSMFNGCTGLTTAPELPATTLTQFAYSYMFNGCSSLNYIKCLATDISATNCTYGWVSGVASTGTFVKNPNMSGWSRSSDGIPKNWTVIDAT